jgi:hypothetical protein
LGEAERDEPFAEIDAIDANARDRAAIAIAPPSWQRLDAARFQNPRTQVCAGGLRQRSFLWTLSAPAALRRVDVFDPVTLRTLAERVAVNDRGIGKHEASREKQRSGHAT